MSADRSKIEPAPGPDPGHGNGRVVGTGARSGRGPVRGIGSIRRIRQALRYRIAMGFAWVAVRALFRVRVEGRDRLPPGPALLCFNHQSWVDPFVLMATLPWRPRLYFFGPKEEDMSRGERNRIMNWTGTTIPFKPGKNDLIDATRRVGAAFEAGGVVAIAGEGRIHDGEQELLPLNEGAAFFALRSKVPLVPVAINGTSWLAFGRRIRIRVGEPIAPTGRPTREAVEELSQRAWTALHELVADYPDPIPPRPGSGWYRFTEAFNEWPEGSRPAGPTRAVGSAAGASGAMGEAVAPEDTEGVPEKGGEDPTDH
jgi:1-acyl-sn-glycerol-3-phosphate acyltransferase